MTINLKEMFDKHDAEYRKYDSEKIINSHRPDLNAFILLDKLVPRNVAEPYTKYIIASAEHDQFWLSTDLDALAEVATEENIITLIRCGIMFDDDLGLSMFV